LAGGKSLAIGVVFVDSNLYRLSVTVLILIEHALAHRAYGNKPFFSQCFTPPLSGGKRNAVRVIVFQANANAGRVAPAIMVKRALFGHTDSYKAFLVHFLESPP
jgi:hypothetical protein